MTLCRQCKIHYLLKTFRLNNQQIFVDIDFFMFFNCPSPCGQYNKVAESTLDPWPRLTGQQVDDTLKGRRCLPLLTCSWQVKNSLVLAVSLTVWPGKSL